MSRQLMPFPPLVPLSRLQNEMNRLFENVLEEGPAARGLGVSFPAINCWEEGDNVFCEAEIPGVMMDHLEVLVSGNEVTINGKRTIEAPKDATYLRRERPQGQFSRMVTLPWEIAAEKVEARLQEGVLTLKLPKSETAKPRKVKVLGA